MKRFFINIKEQALKLHNLIKELDKIPFRALQGDFYDEEEAQQAKPAPRKNNVKVEDLRPQRPSEKTDK